MQKSMRIADQQTIFRFQNKENEAIIMAMAKPRHLKLVEPKRVAIYARYSCDNQRYESITAQLRACHDYCEQRGYKVVGEYGNIEAYYDPTKVRYEVNGTQVRGGYIQLFGQIFNTSPTDGSEAAARRPHLFFRAGGI